MVRNNRTFLLVITFISITSILFGQSIQPGTLWKAETVHDTLHNQYPNEKIERFMYFDNEHLISTLIINEKLNNSNGEIIISYLVDANNLEKRSDTEYKVKEFSVDNFKQINMDSIYYMGRRYNVGFKRFNVKQSSVTEKELVNFLTNESVREYYEQDEPSNQLRSYLDNGKVAIQMIDSHSKWKSDYRIFSFEGFLFLKGITSAPMIIEKIENDIIYGQEVDYRFKPKRFELRKEKL